MNDIYDKPPISETFEECVITAKYLKEDGIAIKIFQCGKTAITLSGTWENKKQNGVNYHIEFGDLIYDRKGFGNFSGFAKQYKDCTQDGSRGNYNGYMTEEKIYKCGAHRVALRGHWLDEYQGHWSYFISLGETIARPAWVENPEKDIIFTNFQRWVPTKLGYRLVGENDTAEEADHGEPPQFVRDVKLQGKPCNDEFNTGTDCGKKPMPSIVYNKCYVLYGSLECSQYPRVYKSADEVGPFQLNENWKGRIWPTTDPFALGLLPTNTTGENKTWGSTSAGYTVSLPDEPTTLSIRCAEGYASIDFKTGKVSYTGGCKASDAGKRLYRYTIKAYRDDCQNNPTH